MAPYTLKTPREWSKAVKMTVAGVTTVGGIIAMFMSVESWTDEKIATAVTASEMRVIQAQARVQVANDINHDKIIQSQRLSEARTNIRLLELELEQLEDEIEYRREQNQQPTVRQERAMARLLDSLRI